MVVTLRTINVAEKIFQPRRQRELYAEIKKLKSLL